jgi:hypothetical protein
LARCERHEPDVIILSESRDTKAGAAIRAELDDDLETREPAVTMDQRQLGRRGPAVRQSSYGGREEPLPRG